MRTRHRLRIPAAIGVTVALTAVLVTSPTWADPGGTEASTCTEVSSYTVCTTRPWERADGIDTSIVDEISRRIDTTSGRGTIRVAMYTWKLTGLAEDLVEARERGADVRVVIGLDGSDPGSADAVRKVLADGDVDTVVCEDGCLPNADGQLTGAMHNKFFIVEDAGRTTVMQSSSNLTTVQLRHAQNMVVSRDDVALYRYYLEYWNRLAAKDWGGWTDADKAARGDKDLSKAYVFPRHTGDSVVATLNNVTACRDGDDRVWVTASGVGRTAVRARLIELQELGCDVKVVVGDPDDEKWMQQPVPGVGQLKAGKVVTFDLNHNKLVIVDAEYAGQWRKTVFAGSHNLSVNALRNSNDVMLRLINARVVNVYIGYFRSMFV